VLSKTLITPADKLLLSELNKLGGHSAISGRWGAFLQDENMNIKDEYFKLCYTKRIHEFSKIDQLKKWESGKAKSIFKTLDEFYMQELNISKERLTELRDEFAEFNKLYTRYFNEQRQELFNHPTELLKWYNDQNGSCNYCAVTQEELLKIVKNRDGNLTLNNKTKRSKGTLEIEKLDPNQGYTLKNSVLACPFCNNAKSNLISEEDWREFFKPAMQQYHKKLLSQQ
tara:strand:+ start:178 stop:858 length:681 start_codon:yes stop_codon:yes gene_type:complete